MQAKRSLGGHALLYPTPVLVVGSYDESDKPDVMTVAWGGLCSSKPPSIAVSVRPSRLTHANILHHRAFTVSIPGEEHVQAADFFGITSGRDLDKFELAGLTAVAAEHVHAPYVGEFPVVLECRLLHAFDLGAHTQFVGEIVDVKVDERALTSEGRLDLSAVGAISFMPGLEAYHALGAKLADAFAVGRALRPSHE